MDWDRHCPFARKQKLYSSKEEAMKAAEKMLKEWDEEDKLLD